MEKRLNSWVHLTSNAIKPLAADLILPALISVITYFALIYLFPQKIEDLISGKWIYIHPGDADENIRTAFLSTWGYAPIKDIAINHTPGVPEILAILNYSGNFLKHEDTIAASVLIQRGSYSATIAFQATAIYCSARLFLSRNIAFWTTLLITTLTTLLFYYCAPLSETYIPCLMCMWGSIFLTKPKHSKGSATESGLANYLALLGILTIVIWIGLTSPFTYLFLWIICTNRFIQDSAKNLGARRAILQTIKINLLLSTAVLAAVEARYGIRNCYKWIIEANKINTMPAEQILQNISHNIFTIDSNLLHSHIAVIVFFIIFLYSKKVSRQNKFAKARRTWQHFSIAGDSKKYFFYAFILLISFSLDGWRAHADTLQGYKSEASWGMILPFLFLILQNIIDKKDSELPKSNANIFHNTYKLALYFITTVLIAVFVSCNASSYAGHGIMAERWKELNETNKPKILHTDKLIRKRKYLKAGTSHSCTLIDSWEPSAWFKYNIQPCRNVFINSIPGLTNIKIFNDDMKNLLDQKNVSIAARKSLSEAKSSDIWPVYLREFSDQLNCFSLDDNYHTRCVNAIYANKKM